MSDCISWKRVLTAATPWSAMRCSFSCRIPHLPPNSLS